MISVARAALLGALVAASTPVVAEGQQSSSDSLNRRIGLLERKVAYLEQRVLELEPSRNQPIAVSANWLDLAKWRRLSRGMNMDQARTLLGEPERVDAISIHTTWTWGTYPDYAEAHFAEGTLAGWSEPRR